MNNAIATAADYADAMITARRAKNWLFLILLLMLLVQVGSFFALRTQHYVEPGLALAIPTTPPTTAEAVPPPILSSEVAAAEPRWVQAIRYATAIINFLGIALVLVLAVVLLLVVKIMLVGRLIGVSRVTSAFIWCIVLAVILFPWQAYLANHGAAAIDFQIPGVLFTWADLQHANFQPASTSEAILKWSRFVVYPIIAILLLLLVQGSSSRGIRAALGEAEGELGDSRIRM